MRTKRLVKDIVTMAYELRTDSFANSTAAAIFPTAFLNATSVLCVTSDCLSRFQLTTTSLTGSIPTDDYLAGIINSNLPSYPVEHNEDVDDVEDYETAFLESPRLPRRSQAVLIVFYMLATCLAVVGNILAIAVFTIGRRSQTELRWFLGNLAAADLTMAVFCMPFTFTNTMLGQWVFSAPMCPVVLFFQTLTVLVSVYTSVAIGVDRYWVVNYPLESRVTKSRSSAVVAVIWIGAGALSGVQLIVGKAEMSPYDEKVMHCNEIWPEPADTWRRSYTFFVLLTTYVIPLVVLSVTYGSVIRKLWKRTAPGNADTARDLQQLRSKRKVIKMLVVVVTLFAVCWLPLHVFITILDFHAELTDYKTAAQKRFWIAFYYCVHWLAMSNSFVNPIIYGFLNDGFRSDLLCLLHRCCYATRCCCRRSSYAESSPNNPAANRCVRAGVVPARGSARGVVFLANNMADTGTGRRRQLNVDDVTVQAVAAAAELAVTCAVQESEMASLRRGSAGTVPGGGCVISSGATSSGTTTGSGSTVSSSSMSRHSTLVPLIDSDDLMLSTIVETASGESADFINNLQL